MYGIIAVLAVIAVAASLYLLFGKRERVVATDADLPVICRKLGYETTDFIVCEAKPGRETIRLVHSGTDGKPYASLDKFTGAMQGRSQPVLMAMNAGMYHDDLSPVGLHVEGGRELSPIQTGDGDGNFFLKPNGILLIGKEGGPAVMETNAYVAANRMPEYATQSGPLLVLNGVLHPRFEENGKSRYTRNGVGVRPDGTAVFAISLTEEVSFGSFARLFRDALGCPDALYFDGVVSTLSNGSTTMLGGKYPAGPIVAVLPARH